MSTETSQKFNSETRYNGQVKWFNNKAGYGFITMNHGDDTYDIFVHHSSLSVTNEQYKYLVQGEYVEFNIARITTENATHEWQAIDVTGFNRGFLMCETRYNTRSTRRTYTRSTHDETGQTQTSIRSNTQTYTEQRPHSNFTHHRVTDTIPSSHGRQYSRHSRCENIPVRFYGQGPRGENGEQWLLVRSNLQNQNHYQQGQKQRRRPYTQHIQSTNQ
jgi:cold shock CspA family protein